MKVNFLLSMGMLLSLLIHGIGGTMVVLRFSVTPSPFKPEFVSLGPILRRIDARSTVKTRGASFAGEEVNVGLRYKDQDVSPNPVFNPRRTWKPTLIFRETNPRDKKTLKMLWDLSQEAVEKQGASDALKEEMPAIPEVFPYRPLRYQTR